ncbi:MAG TPA: N-formylglutamate amidohydrolase [Steroidobacteraceae bacterium]|nr:N-formylglutamate amidohydrolase [Steroidobacteraceae bacterium]
MTRNEQPASDYRSQVSAPSGVLLSTDEPAAFALENAQGASPFVLTCDHASCRVPRKLASLGLSAEQLSGHIGWDIGAADVARLLAQQLDAPLILQNYSRLVIDCNRPPNSSESIPVASDSVRVPGNEHLDDAAIGGRRREIFDPYHASLRSMLEQRIAANRTVVVIAVHSFTPTMGGVARPWHVGVMYRKSRFALVLLNTLRQNAELLIGDNQPYAIEDGIDYSIPHHCESRGIAHAGLEIRQDLIFDAARHQAWATMLCEALHQAFARTNDQAQPA